MSAAKPERASAQALAGRPSRSASAAAAAQAKRIAAMSNMQRMELALSLGRRNAELRRLRSQAPQPAQGAPSDGAGA